MAGADVYFSLGQDAGLVHWNKRELGEILQGSSGPVFRQMVNTLEDIKSRAQQEAPVVTGNLRDRIVKRINATTGGELTGTVTTEGVPYAVWVHEGRGEVVPINGTFLHWISPSGEHVFARRSRAVEPNRFLIRAAVAVVGQGNVRTT